MHRSHLPIPCLNGNLLNLDAYFNDKPDEKSWKLLTFNNWYQRFDDGVYKEPKPTARDSTPIIALPGVANLPIKARF